ncbi:BrnA antitoxin family protein [candidate division KSB1 bacterium]|nr:BrnA antitoxin family protein [candidate division KSB1 bacterium]
MNKKYSSKASQTDWDRIYRMRDEDIDLSEIPEITAKQMARTVLRVGGKPAPKGKVQVNLSLDAGVVAYFKTQAGGRNFQKLINEALKTKIRDQNIENILRRVIREELQGAG